jgi:RimJ/RimL family protein N-acetyltransferase
MSGGSLLIAPEWLGHSGLWQFDGKGRRRAVDAEDIGLSEALADRLETWMDAFDAIYDEDDEAASDFSNEVERLAWQTEGHAIAHAVAAELGPGWEVRQDWKAPPFPPAKVLEGRYCRLEPLDTARHLDDIWAATAGHDAMWDWLPARPPKDKDEYRALLDSMVAKEGIVPLAVIDKADGKAKGHLWIMEIRPAHGVFEVGWVTFSPSLQRTRMATEAIYLVGDYGFSLGYRRYEWKCNNLNEPSKRAALRFGFQYEGVFRQHMVVKGENRDTAWFAMLDSDWPARARAFQAWLAPGNFDAQGQQKASLADFARAG